MGKYIARLNAKIGPKGFFKRHIYTKKEYLDYKPYFEEVKSMFTDKRDVVIYSSIIEARRIQSRNIKSLAFIYIPMLWQYVEFVNRKKIRVIIDGGTSTGWQLQTFLLFFGNKITIFGFEPWYKLYVRSRIKPYIDFFNIKVFPVALGRKSGRVKFYEDNVSSTIIKEKYPKKKSGTIKVISIDEFCKKNKIPVDYIKLDVEGSEYDVLLGAEKTIKKQRPQLAISIYHSKTDLFRIPLLLKKMLKNYYYKISHYHTDYRETILYALPKEVFSRRSMIVTKLPFDVNTIEEYLKRKSQ